MSCFKDFLEKCKRTNPAIFKAETIQMRVSSLEAAMEKAYDAGRNDGLCAAMDFRDGYDFGKLEQFLKSR